MVAATESLDATLGMHTYLTKSEGTGGRIKQQADDFIVEEIPRLPPMRDDGRFLICRVSVRNWETNRLIRELSRRLHISRNRIGFAGTKDKRGVTTQYMSFEDVGERDVEALSMRDIEIRTVGRCARALKLGDLFGNRFTVVIRECNFSGNALHERICATADWLMKYGGFPNYFGVQRFGSLRPNTHRVGIAIVKGDFREAVCEYAGHPIGNEEENVRRAREMVDAGLPPAQIISLLPEVMTFEKTILQHLIEREDDYAGALRQLPRNLLMMFVHALQGRMFNEMLSLRMIAELPLNRPLEGDIVLRAAQDGLPDRDMMIHVSSDNVGNVTDEMSKGHCFVSALLFGHRSIFASGFQGEIERRVVADFGLSEENFIVPAIPECTSSGARREVLSPLKNMDVSIDGSDATVTFDLTRGSYATSLLREIMKE